MEGWVFKWRDRGKYRAYNGGSRVSYGRYKRDVCFAEGLEWAKTPSVERE